MTPRTSTLPPTEPAMWRKLLARVHPDAGVDHELFIWSKHLHDVVCGGEDPSTRREPPRQEPPPRRDPPRPEQPKARVPFDEAFSKASSFTDLTRQAVERAEGVDPTYARLLRLLEDCTELEEGPLYSQQHQGATYKTLAAIGYAAGMTGAERSEWYELAESIPLSQRHAGHILSKLKEGG